MAGMITESDSETINLHKKIVKRVLIPAGLMRELEASGLRGLAKDEIYLIVSMCQTLKSKAAKVNQRVLGAAINSTQRANIIRFIKSSKYIQVASSGSYEVGQRCLSYELTDEAQAELAPVLARQHMMNKGVVLVDGCVDECVGWWVNGGVGLDVAGERRVCCVADADCSADECDFCSVVWRSVDFSALFERLQTAYRKLGWDQSVLHAEWALMLVDPTEISGDEFAEIAISSVEEKLGRTASRDELKPYFDAYSKALARFANRRTSNVSRKDGRTYHSATNLPRKLRARVVRFDGNAESLDIRSCYAWILAARHRRFLVSRGSETSAVDSLMDMIDDGRLYSTLAEVADLPYETDSEKRRVKADFQQFCLFGKIGWHPLWHALESICPGVCKDIRWWRSQQGGASRLADMLQRSEGALMTDGLVRHLHECKRTPQP